MELALWDTAGQEDYDRLRPLSYPDTDVVLLCFSIEDRDSLENVSEKWGPEVGHYCPGVPVILVGNKLDLRSDPQTLETLAKSNKAPVSSAEGQLMAEKIGARAYLECSAKTKEGVQKVFEVATRASFQVWFVLFKLRQNSNYNLIRGFELLEQRQEATVLLQHGIRFYRQFSIVM